MVGSVAVGFQSKSRASEEASESEVLSIMDRDDHRTHVKCEMGGSGGVVTCIGPSDSNGY
jgi:hypothetical protein